MPPPLPPLPPLPPSPASRRARGGWTLALVALGGGATSLLLCAWAVYIAYGGFLVYGDLTPPAWPTTVLRWYPVLALGGIGAGGLLALWLARRGVRSFLAGLVPAVLAGFPAALLLVGWFRPPQPLDGLEFATRAERRLAAAAVTGDLAALERSLRDGVSPDAATVDGKRVLARCIVAGQHAAFARLLEVGASPGTLPSDPWSASPVETLAGRRLSPPADRWLALLLDHGLPLTWKEPDFGRPLLDLFAALDDEASVRLLLERGADPAVRWRDDGSRSSAAPSRTAATTRPRPFSLARRGTTCSVPTGS